MAGLEAQKESDCPHIPQTYGATCCWSTLGLRTGDQLYRVSPKPPTLDRFLTALAVETWEEMGQCPTCKAMRSRLIDPLVAEWDFDKYASADLEVGDFIGYAYPGILTSKRFAAWLSTNAPTGLVLKVVPIRHTHATKRKHGKATAGISEAIAIDASVQDIDLARSGQLELKVCTKCGSSAYSVGSETTWPRTLTITTQVPTRFVFRLRGMPGVYCTQGLVDNLDIELANVDFNIAGVIDH